MALRKPANEDLRRERKEETLPHFASGDFFTREAASMGEATRSFTRYLTLKNIVIFLGLATFLIFLGSAVSARIAFLFAALTGLAGLFLLDIAARRKWEAEMAKELQKMHLDYERLVREVARNRNEITTLRKTLSDAGDLARSHDKKTETGEVIEQRMIRSIAEQLSSLATPPQPEAPAEKPPVVHVSPGVEIESLNDKQVVDIVRGAVKEDRVDLFMQPIVSLPQRKTRFLETFSRIRVGHDQHLPAQRYIRLAMQQDLLPAIDNLLLLSALRHLRDTGEEDGNRAYFCNITSLTLNDPKFMGDLVEFVAQNRALAPRIVFELAQRDLATMSPDTLPVLQGLSRLGCRFSMDRVDAVSFDYAHLDARHIRFIKVNADLILKEMKELGGLNRMKRLKSALDHRGIDLIVDKIETERQVRELLDIGIDYGQGFLFGKPAAA